MKKLCAIICFLFISLTFAQDKLSLLDKSDMETSILFVTFPVIDIGNYQEATNTSYSFLQTYKAIANNDLQNRFVNLETFETQLKQNNNAVVPLGILHTEYEVIKPEAIENGIVTADANGNIIRTNNTSIYNKKKLSIVTPLKTKHKGLQTTFKLTEAQIINTTQNNITSIKMDFNDGNNLVNVPLNTNIVVNYSDKGIKELTAYITFADGTSIVSKSSIEITHSRTDINQLFNRVITELPPAGSTNSIAPNLTPYGVANDIGEAEYDVFLSPDNILDKPIILIDGFDPGDSRDILGLYDLLNFDDNGTPSNLGDVVRAEGFDVVVLNFPVYTRASDMVEVDGGADFIERNAMLLVELIEIINNDKVGSEQNVIIGPSMGGLISRYALNFMENQSIPHDTRLWISFDAPHHGANVPIGFQYLFNNMAYNLDLGGLGGDQSIVSLRPVIDGMLKSPAARQMLTDQFEPHIGNATITPIAHAYKDLFFNSLNGLTASGFPELTRNVSMINGSGMNNPYQDKVGVDILPNREILNTTIEVVAGFTDATFRTRFTPTASATNEASFIFIDSIFICFCDLTLTEDSTAFSFTNGIDAGSGGLFNIGGLAGGLGADPLIDAFFDALQTDYFNFIPSVSAMAMDITSNEVDWFHDIDLGAGSPPTTSPPTFAVENNTPFVNWYMPTENEGHVELTEANVTFALSEIILETLNTPNTDKGFIKLEHNPIQNELVILNTTNTQQAQLQIVDVTGKVVFKNNTQSLNERTSIALNLASGLYILNMKFNNQEFKTKFIVN